MTKILKWAALVATVPVTQATAYVLAAPQPIPDPAHPPAIRLCCEAPTPWEGSASCWLRQRRMAFSVVPDFCPIRLE